MLSKSALDLYVEARAASPVKIIRYPVRAWAWADPFGADTDRPATPDIDAERRSKLLLARDLDGTGTELRDIESWLWRTAELRCDAYPNL